MTTKATLFWQEKGGYVALADVFRCKSGCFAPEVGVAGAFGCKSGCFGPEGGCGTGCR